MNKPTLVILAAGMASRYGSMKQVESFGPNGETIMDYSIYDAVRAGFQKVVFIIREEFATLFKEKMEPKLAGKIETAYCYQALADFLPDGFSIPADRSKPWGTAHAILCTEEVIDGNFVVINADDFYGEDGFRKAYDFCVNGCNETNYGIIGYTLSRTLSNNGSVSRGVCQTNDSGNLVQINERTKIYRKDDIVVYEEDGVEVELAANSPVSMNFWCFAPSVFTHTKAWFKTFIESRGQELKSEFFLPLVAEKFIAEGLGQLKVIPTEADWFGVTYKEDAPVVKASVDALVADGKYPAKLW